jgi:hypothetical protein
MNTQKLARDREREREREREKEEGRKRLTELAKHEGRKGDASTRMEVTFEGVQDETGRQDIV